MTQHIEEQLRGLIVALFVPVFFGVAGLSIDLKILGDPHLLGLALLLIGIASHPEQFRRTTRALLDDIVALGERESVRVVTKALVSAAKESAILQQAKSGAHQLMVIGTKARSGDELHFGHSAETLIANAPCPILLLKS